MSCIFAFIRPKQYILSVTVVSNKLASIISKNSAVSAQLDCRDSHGSSRGAVIKSPLMIEDHFIFSYCTPPSSTVPFSRVDQGVILHHLSLSLSSRLRKALSLYKGLQQLSLAHQVYSTAHTAWLFPPSLTIYPERLSSSLLELSNATTASFHPFSFPACHVKSLYPSVMSAAVSYRCCHHW